MSVSPTVSIQVDRYNKIYRVGEEITGKVIFANFVNPLPHEGVYLELEGVLRAQLGAKAVGSFDAVFSTIQPVLLAKETVCIASSGKLSNAHIPFKVPIKPQGNVQILQSVKGIDVQLLETYTGVYINVQYVLSISINKRPKGVAEPEILKITVVQEPKKMDVKPLEFTLTPESLVNANQFFTGGQENLQFSIKGFLKNTNQNLDEEFMGYVIIENAALPIRSVDLQLLRIEWVQHADGWLNETTEVQNLQMAEGDVLRNVEIPLYMVLPRIFACQNFQFQGFKLEFAANLQIVFSNGYAVTKNIPLFLHR